MWEKGAAVQDCGAFFRPDISHRLRPLSHRSCPIIAFEKQGGKRCDGRLYRQRFCAKRLDGLSALSLCRPAGGAPPAAGTLYSGGPGGGRLRGGGVSAGAGLFGPNAGKAGGRGAAGPHCLWWRGETAEAAAAVFCSFLCHGGVYTGSGPAGGGRRACGARRILYRCGRKNFGSCRDGGLHRFFSGFPGGGVPRGPGRVTAGPGFDWGPDGGADGPVGYRQRPSVSGRTGGIGDGPGGLRHRSASGSCEIAPPAGVGGAGRAFRTAALRCPGAASQAGALPGSGDGGGTAADHPDGLGGSQRDPVSGADGGTGSHGSEYGLYGALGRTGGKGRTKT